MKLVLRLVETGIAAFTDGCSGLRSILIDAGITDCRAVAVRKSKDIGYSAIRSLYPRL
jgi:hypothetical protein